MFEDSKDFQEMEKIINSSLKLQWNDLLKSGIVKDVFDEEFYSLNENDKKILKVGLLLLFLKRFLRNNFKSVLDYNNLREELKNYFKRIANIGGQSIIDEITNLRFRLSNQEYIDKIEARIEQLGKDLDKTTKTRFANSVVAGMKSSDDSKDVFDTVVLRGNEVSDNRSKVITLVETMAIYNYMRQETADKNGCQFKIWQSSGLPNMCGSCADLNGVRLPMNQPFESGTFSVMQCPGHCNCSCTIAYEMDNFCSNYDETAEKSYKFYENNKDKSFKCVNPNAVWAGGESLVGDDKNIGNYYERIKNTKGEERNEILEMARQELTKDGFIQLNLILK